MNIFDSENIFIFGIFVVFFSIIVLFYSEQVHENVYGLIYMAPIVVITIMSFSLAYKYKKVTCFFIAHLVLGLAFTSHLVAELLWLLMGFWEIPQYESYPDIFYILYGMFLITHPWIILKHFKVKPSKIAWLALTLLIIGGNGIYCILSIDYFDSDSFYFGLGFVTLTSILIGSAIIAILTLHGTKIFRVLVIIGIAYTINAIADIYYYASENFTDWTQGDYVNIIWFIGYVVLIYGLMEHRYKYSIRRR
jgi:hypothetical protein